MIRGKAYSEKKIIPRETNVGKPVFIKNKKDEWVNKNGEPIRVTTQSLKEALENLQDKNSET